MTYSQHAVVPVFRAHQPALGRRQPAGSESTVAVRSPRAALGLRTCRCGPAICTTRCSNAPAVGHDEVMRLAVWPVWNSRAASGVARDRSADPATEERQPQLRLLHTDGRPSERSAAFCPAAAAAAAAASVGLVPQSASAAGLDRDRFRRDITSTPPLGSRRRQHHRKWSACGRLSGDDTAHAKLAPSHGVDAAGQP